MLSSQKTSTAEKRKFLLSWAVLLTAVGAVFLIAPLRSAFLGQAMLFTQKSAQTLAGALRSSGRWRFCYALFLAVFRAMVLVWIPPLLTVADTMVFGKAVGILTAWLGNLLAAQICFMISRQLLGKAVQRRMPDMFRQKAADWGGTVSCAIVLMFPGMGGLAAYLLGMSGLPQKRWLIGIGVGELAAAAAYGLCCSPYSQSLPSGVEQMMRAAAVLLVLLTLGLKYREKGRKAR